MTLVSSSPSSKKILENLKISIVKELQRALVWDLQNMIAIMNKMFKKTKSMNKIYVKGYIMYKKCVGKNLSKK